MAKEYKLKKITTETYVAACKACGKQFASDVKQKAIDKAKDHYRDKHETR